MIKLIAIEPKAGTQLLLRFSDGAWGVYDFATFIVAKTQMTTPLGDPAFFARYFIEAGALAWPNGFDLSAGSLNQRLQDVGGLQCNEVVPDFREVDSGSEEYLRRGYYVSVKYCHNI